MRQVDGTVVVGAVLAFMFVCCFFSTWQIGRHRHRWPRRPLVLPAEISEGDGGEALSEAQAGGADLTFVFFCIQ